METNIVNFVGIDISKEKFDAAIIVGGNKEELQTRVFEQNKKGFNELLKWVKQHAKETYEQTFYCMEHTGIYNIALVEFLSESKVMVCVEDAKQIKMSMGLQRGKNDVVDAKRIAHYAFKNYDELKQWQMPRKELKELKILLTQRDLLIQTKTNLGLHINELNATGLKSFVKQLQKYTKGLKGIEKDIAQIEKDINALIREDENLNKLMKQITSVPSVGVITATHLMVSTNEFKAIKSGKQLACYCGVAPFEHSSGSSLRGRTRVSHAANKKLKTLLHLCAVSSISRDGVFKDYYQRKKEQGKNAMSILNAIRNKMLLAITAVVKNNTLYVNNYVYKA